MNLFNIRRWFQHCSRRYRGSENLFSAGLVIHLAITVVTIGMLPANGGDLPQLSVNVSSCQYSFSDTLIIAVKVQIPEGFVLVGNPKGPGTGRPSKIRILSSDTSVHWLEVRKMKAEKYGLPFGDWIWAYHHEAFFFCTGVVSRKPETTPVQFEGIVEFEGLLCRDECRLVVLKAPLLLSITGKKSKTVHFGQSGSLMGMFAQTMPMMVLEQAER